MSDEEIQSLKRRWLRTGAEEDREALQAARCRMGKHDGGVETGTDGCEGCFVLFLGAQRQKALDAPRTRFA